MKKVGLKLFSCIAIVIALYSCSEDLSLVTPINEKNETLEILTLPNAESLLTIIKGLENDSMYLVKNNYNLKRAETTFVNLKSATLTNEPKENAEEYDLVYSDLLLECLNDQYEIIIGDVFFKVTPIGTVFSLVSDKDIIEKITFDDEFINNSIPTSGGLGYEGIGYYSHSSYPGLFVFDTYGFFDQKVNQQKVSPFQAHLSSIVNENALKSMPSNVSWAI